VGFTVIVIAMRPAEESSLVVLAKII